LIGITFKAVSTAGVSVMVKFIVCVLAIGACGSLQPVKRFVSAVNPADALNKVLSDHPHAIPVYSHRIGR
jgi:hypothetical protein